MWGVGCKGCEEGTNRHSDECRKRFDDHYKPLQHKKAATSRPLEPKASEKDPAEQPASAHEEFVLPEPISLSAGEGGVPPTEVDVAEEMKDAGEHEAPWPFDDEETQT